MNKIVLRNKTVFMKKHIIVSLAIFYFLSGFAQQNNHDTNGVDTTGFSKKYYHHKNQFELLPNRKKEIVFLGNSITARGNWSEWFNNKRIINRGISGDRTDGVLYRLDEVISSKPKKIFLLIGVNDIKYKRSNEYIIRKIHQIIKRIKKKSPKTEVFIQSILPTYGREKHRPVGKVKTINTGLKKISLKENVKYIDLFSRFIDDSGFLNKTYSLDGLHLNGHGYLLWKQVIEKYVMK